MLDRIVRVVVEGIGDERTSHGDGNLPLLLHSADWGTKRQERA